MLLKVTHPSCRLTSDAHHPKHARGCIVDFGMAVSCMPPSSPQTPDASDEVMDILKVTPRRASKTSQTRPFQCDQTYFLYYTSVDVLSCRASMSSHHSSLSSSCSSFLNPAGPSLTSTTPRFCARTGRPAHMCSWSP
ncbi:hypothetical protein BS17DRAFT_272988 [Gyrodon lividus]|nr:hypothetical protein BS17DRAFT_272988 [Gyrodon lividus]